jgi:tetratricopeptide (TPR) repeat protein
MADVFVSYARENRPQIRHFVEYLEQLGWSVWWDSEIVPGHSFGSEIDKQLAESRCVVVFWSSHSVDSNWVQAEANEGLERGILVPALLDNSRPPLQFRRLETVDLKGWPNRHNNEQFERFIDAIGTYLQSEPTDRSDKFRVRKLGKFLQAGFVTAAAIIMILLAYVFLNEVDTPIEQISYDSPALPSEPRATLAVMPFTELDVDISPELSRLFESTGNIQITQSSRIDAYLKSPAESSLSARYSVQGSVAGSELTASMLDRETMETLWQDTFSLNKPMNSVVTGIASGVAAYFKAPIAPQQAVSHINYLDYLRAKAMIRNDRSEDALQRALEVLEKVVDQSPRFGEAYALKCDILTTLFLETQGTEHFEDAERSCFRAATITNDNGLVDFALGRLYRIAGQDDVAAERLEAALRRTPFATEVLRELALVRFASNQPKEAHRLLEAAQDLEPDYWKNYDDQAALYFKTGKYLDAAAKYQKMRELDVNLTRVLNDLGSAYFMAEEFNAAVEAWEQSLAQSQEPYSLSNLGSAYFFNGQYQLAFETYGKAVKLSPMDPRLWANKGEAAMQIGMNADEFFQRAVDLCQEQYKVNPDNGEIVSLLASSHAALGNVGPSETMVQRALTLAQNDVYVLYDVAVAYARLGKEQQKDETIERMTRLGYSSTLVSQDANLTRREQ